MDEQNTATRTAATKLFKLPEQEAARLNEQFAQHEARKTAAGTGNAAQQALFDQLLKEYPPEEGARVWTHKHLGEDKYIEVAINGRYFDPRTESRDYRPDLDIPDFGGASQGEPFRP